VNLIEVNDLGDERVASYRLRRQRIPVGDEMVIDSEKVVARALQSDIKIKSILGTKEYFTKHAGLMAGLDCQLYCVEHKLLETIVGHRIHQGIMAVAERPVDTPLTKLGSRIVVLNRVLDIQNVGAIVRSCHAFGVRSVLVDGKGCSPYGRRAIRVSMGSIFKMNVLHSPDIVADLEWLKAQDYQIIEAANSSKAVPINMAKFREKSVMIIGNEDSGVTEGVQNLCDLTVKIPVEESIDSLNAACAASVLLYSWKLSIH
jgi:tRNA G18 (ribose-2'-O)-methylase SpoU